jgi:hypothetical protein
MTVCTRPGKNTCACPAPKIPTIIGSTTVSVKRGGHRRVHRIATRRKHLNARRRSQRMIGDDHPPRRPNRPLLGLE